MSSQNNDSATKSLCHKFKEGEVIFEDSWKVYRHDIGIGEFEYVIFHNGNFFASVDSMVKGERIINSILKTTGIWWREP